MLRAPKDQFRFLNKIKSLKFPVILEIFNYITSLNNNFTVGQ